MPNWKRPYTVAEVRRLTAENERLREELQYLFERYGHESTRLLLEPIPATSPKEDGMSVRTERRGGLQPTGGTAEEYPRTPTAPMGETDAKVVREALLRDADTGTPKEFFARMAALDRILAELAQVKAERDKARSEVNGLETELQFPSTG